MRLGLALLSTVGLSGCDFVWRIDTFDHDARTADVATIDAPCTPMGMSGGKGLIQICVPNALPHDDYVFMDGFDSMSDCDSIVTQSDGTTTCVIIARSIHIATPVNTKGARAVVLVGVDSIELSGNLNFAARATGDKGPGSDYPGCASGPGDAANSGGAGGGGGTFQNLGGTGGDGKVTIGGHRKQLMTPTTVRAGCAGGNGGDGHLGSSAGPGGSSGGAVYMISNGPIHIAGNINASGAGGGLGGMAGSTVVSDGGGGGGGGGSGGLIAFDAPMITVDSMAMVFANGGGGGSSGGNMINGMVGADGTMATWDSPAPGGNVATTAFGGAGSALTTAGIDGGTNSKSGGGGGGGAGYVLVYTSGTPPVFQSSPPAIVNL